MSRFLIVLIPILSIITFHGIFWWLDITLKNRGLKNQNQDQNYGKDFSILYDNILKNKSKHRTQYLSAFSAIIFCLISFIGISVWLMFDLDDHKCVLFENYLEQNVNSKIDSIYIDYQNHSIKTLKLKNQESNSSILIYRPDLYGFLQKGDSIVKLKTSPNIQVFRGENFFNFEVLKKEFCQE